MGKNSETKTTKEAVVTYTEIAATAENKIKLQMEKSENGGIGTKLSHSNPISGSTGLSPLPPTKV